ncbi:hypothetical protein THAOC_30263, partial [Thalassiosira oceanica]
MVDLTGAKAAGTKDEVEDTELDRMNATFERMGADDENHGGGPKLSNGMAEGRRRVPRADPEGRPGRGSRPRRDAEEEDEDEDGGERKRHKADGGGADPSSGGDGGPVADGADPGRSPAMDAEPVEEVGKEAADAGDVEMKSEEESGPEQAATSPESGRSDRSTAGPAVGNGSPSKSSSSGDGDGPGTTPAGPSAGTGDPDVFDSHVRVSSSGDIVLDGGGGEAAVAAAGTAKGGRDGEGGRDGGRGRRAVDERKGRVGRRRDVRRGRRG